VFFKNLMSTHATVSDAARAGLASLVRQVRGAPGFGRALAGV
jgi:hypothetical protein